MKISLILSICFFFSGAISAQPRNSGGVEPLCVANSNSAVEATWRWPANSRVTIFALRNDFSSSELNLLRRAIDNWNAALREVCVDVQFSFGGESAEISSKDGHITINRGSTYHNHRHLAEIYPVFKTADELGSALITIDAGVKDSEALTSVITHELGHSLGIEDCAKCKRGTTVMGLYRGRNQSNDANTPSVCDRVVVARGYRH